MSRALTSTACIAAASFACSAPPPPRVAPAVVDLRLTVEAPPPAPVARHAPPPPACPARAHPLPDGQARPLVVASAEDGLREVAYDGTVLRVLSRTPAEYPRFDFDPPRAVVFLVPGRGEVRSLSLADCTERVVATLPRNAGLSCGGVWDRPYDPVEAVHSDDDVEIDAAPDGDGGDALCVRLMDRNVNMANVIVAMRVELATGAESHQVVLGPGCAPPNGVTAQNASRCERLARTAWPRWARHGGGAPVRANDRAAPFTFADGRVVRRGADRRHDALVAQIAATDVSEETVSPSGRYSVVSANRDEGDYVYRQLVLFDRQEGTFRSLHPSASWPAPLTAEQLASVDAMRDAFLTATGETTVRWLGDGDRLVVGGLLVEPGRRIVSLGGSLAW